MTTRGESLYPSASIVLEGLSTSLLIRTNPASPAALISMANPVSNGPGQIDEMRILKEAYLQSTKLVNRQGDDIERLIKSVRSLKAELQEIKVRVESLEATDPYQTVPNKIQDGVHSTAARTPTLSGSLPRRPHYVAHSVHEIDMSGTIAASSNTVEGSPWQQTNNNVTAAGPLERSPVTSRKNQSASIESLGPGETLSLVDKPTNSSHALTGRRHGSTSFTKYVHPSAGTIESKAEQNESDTQQYLRRTVPMDDLDDVDYSSSDRSASPISYSGDIPDTVEIQSSLDHILDPVTPARPMPVASGRSRGSGRKGVSMGYKWIEDQRATPEWERDDWSGPETSKTTKDTAASPNPHSRTPTHARGQHAGRRGVSGSLGSHSASKRKSLQGPDGVEKQRDSEGYLIKADGSRDMRSARYRDRAIEENEAGDDALERTPKDGQPRKVMEQIHPERR